MSWTSCHQFVTKRLVTTNVRLQTLLVTAIIITGIVANLARWRNVLSLTFQSMHLNTPTLHMWPCQCNPFCMDLRITISTHNGYYNSNSSINMQTAKQCECARVMFYINNNNQTERPDRHIHHFTCHSHTEADIAPHPSPHPYPTPTPTSRLS